MNVPKLRFSEFSENYKKIKLKNMTKLITKGTTPRKYTDSGVNFIKVENLLDNQIKNINSYISYETHNNELKRSILKEYDILFSIAGALGRAAIVTKEELPANTNQACSIIRLDNLNDYNLYYLMERLHHFDIKSYINKCQSVGAQPNLSLEQVGNICINIPNKKEQDRVGRLIELVNKKIELQTKKIDALKLFKLSITQNIFNEKKLNDFQSVTLEKILKPGSKIPVKNTSEYEKMTVKLNFKGLAKLETKKEMADTRPFYVRNENEIIIGKQNYFNGSIAKVTKDFKGCICSNAIMSFTTINGVNVDYVLYYLSQKNYINRRKFLANGTGQKELSEKEFLKFVIKLPSTQIQNNISKKISCVSNLLLLENKKLTTLNNLKKGVLQNLFI